MNSIDTRTAIEGIATTVGTRPQSDSHSGKSPVKDSSTQSGPHTQPNTVQTDVSFSTYGSKNEHLAVVVTNKETGEIIREIPTKEMQKLHVHLDVMV